MKGQMDFMKAGKKQLKQRPYIFEFPASVNDLLKLICKQFDGSCTIAWYIFVFLKTHSCAIADHRLAWGNSWEVVEL